MTRIKELIRPLIPEPVARQVRKLIGRPQLRGDGIGSKYGQELIFWESWIRDHGAAPETDYYRKFMLAMGGLSDPDFFRTKICVDIGCGPMGSLTWLDGIAKAAVGVDPLAQQYMRFGIDRHAMIYLNAPVEALPFPSEYVDVVFSMNSLDHVDNLVVACCEIRRVIKRGGYFIASLNLDQPATGTEPWSLTEAQLDHLLFAGWTPEFR